MGGHGTGHDSMWAGMVLVMFDSMWAGMVLVMFAITFFPPQARREVPASTTITIVKLPLLDCKKYLA